MGGGLVSEAEIRFVVFGRPQGKGSKRVLPIRGKDALGSGRVVLVDSNKNARPWANQVGDKARQAAIENGWGPLRRGPVWVELRFYFKRPRGHYGTGRNAGTVKPSAPKHVATMPDLDKLARCTLDALTGVLIADDAQIVALGADKRYGEPERVEVHLRELGS
jgi:Endodeoxyribonuclease RusA